MFAVLVLSLSALGQIDGDPDNWCREGFYTRDSSKFFVGSVVGKKGSRSYIYDDLSEKRARRIMQNESLFGAWR
jgi:hypothetical protein